MRINYFIYLLICFAFILNFTVIPANESFLNLKLEAGKKLSVTIDPSKRLRSPSKYMSGISFHKVSGWADYPYSSKGKYNLSKETEQLIKDLKIPLTRFYALGDEKFPADLSGGEASSIEPAIDRIADMAKRFGIPEDRIVLELENQGAKTLLPAQVWKRAVQYSISKGYKFRFWEISNEPYKKASIFKTPSTYARHFIEISKIIKEVQPDALTIISLKRDNDNFCKDILKYAAGYYDMVAPHWYTFVIDEFEETVLGENVHIIKRIKNLNDYIRKVNNGRVIGQFDTEWGLLAKTRNNKRPDYNVQNSNIIGTVYRAVRMIYYISGDFVTAASGWQMFTKTPQYGCSILVSGDRYTNTTSMLYWLYYYFNRYTGDWLIDGAGTAPHYTIRRAKMVSGWSVPETPMLITLSDDGNILYVIIVNASWKNDCNASLSIKKSHISGAEGLFLSNDNPDAIPVVENKNDFVHELPVQADHNSISFILPAHSVSFIKIRLNPIDEKNQ